MGLISHYTYVDLEIFVSFDSGQAAAEKPLNLEGEGLKYVDTYR